MPPKKPNAPSKKNVEKVKAKVVEDKTFGLKNKKGKKQQTYIKTVNQQVSGNKKDLGSQESTKLSKREQEKQKLEELNALFKPVQQAQKVAAGVDPKSVLCAYFKVGTCQKGTKCKFSHDLSIERKSEKKNLYEDSREGEKGGMEDWDQDTLEDVINKKHGTTNNTNKTEIVCKFFLDAVEKGLYGWFWNCPNSDKCIYRHALPPGFVLKKDKKSKEERDLLDKVSLEEHIENERRQLSGDLTPVTYETFLAWKKRKVDEKKASLAKEMSKKKEEFKSGRIMSKISGKEVFLFKPELADADDDEADDDMSMYRRHNQEDGEEEDDTPCAEINLESFAADAAGAAANDTRVTRVKTLLAKDRENVSGPSMAANDEETKIDDTSHADTNGLDQASSLLQDDVLDGVPVDESLFEDLDDLDIEDD